MIPDTAGRNKKAQIQGQIVVYVLASVVVILILIYGYKAIEGFKDQADTVDYIQFHKDFDKVVQSVAGDFGSELVETFHLPMRSDEVCFVSSEDVETSSTLQLTNSPGGLGGNKDIIFDSVLDGEGVNVFLFKDKGGYPELNGAPFKVDNLMTGSWDLVCVEAAGYDVRLRFVGRGAGTDVAEAP